jgi:hypothetical protein
LRSERVSYPRFASGELRAKISSLPSASKASSSCSGMVLAGDDAGAVSGDADAAGDVGGGVRADCDRDGVVGA